MTDQEHADAINDAAFKLTEAIRLARKAGLEVRLFDSDGHRVLDLPETVLTYEVMRTYK